MTILEVGSEGGTLSLFGKRNENGAWSFWVGSNETAAYDALSEEDRVGIEPRSVTGSVSSIEAAMKLLDQYPWFRLSPIMVHPEFRHAILLEVRKRGTAEDEARWSESLRQRQGFATMIENSEVPVRRYSAGMIVDLRTKPEWGPGKIVHADSDKLHIIFRDREDQTAKVFVISTPALHEAASQSDSVLDNLPPLKRTEGGWQLPRSRMSFERAKSKFLHLFPRGFSDPQYLSNEREYKMAAHERFVKELGLEEAKQMLSDGDIASIISRGSSILNSVNLIAPFESAAFHDAMLDTGAARAFYAALFQLLEPPEISAAVFDPYADAIMSLPALRGRVASWPVATVLPCIAQPDRFMFLKPEATKVAAETLAFDLHYDSTLNWTTYSALLRMGDLYLERLRHMGAQDFVDVQTFIFVIGGGYD